ncbi:MAG: prolyl-tRNA synthetase associated domain-containing protein [Clostridia bacterium]|nr:prolyl-tRNA synthetase associated domain-containing protein [Clostridia bacterium]
MSALCEGRPASLSGRTEKELAVYDTLDRLGIAYTHVDHAPAATMEDCLAVERQLGVAVCKNLFLTNRQHTAYYLLLMPGDKPFRTKDLSAEIGSARLSFATPEEMERLLRTEPGSASVLGLMHDTEREVALLIDKDILEAEAVGVHPLVNTSSLRLKVADILDVFLPAVGHTYRKVTL